MGMKRMKQHFLNAIVWCGKGNEKGADSQKRKGGKAIKARLPSVVYEIRLLLSAKTQNGKNIQLEAL